MTLPFLFSTLHQPPLPCFGPRYTCNIKEQVLDQAAVIDVNNRVSRNFSSKLRRGPVRVRRSGQSREKKNPPCPPLEKGGSINRQTQVPLFLRGI